MIQDEGYYFFRYCLLTLFVIHFIFALFKHNLKVICGNNDNLVYRLFFGVIFTFFLNISTLVSLFAIYNNRFKIEYSQHREISGRLSNAFAVSSVIGLIGIPIILLFFLSIICGDVFFKSIVYFGEVLFISMGALVFSLITVAILGLGFNITDIAVFGLLAIVYNHIIRKLFKSIDECTT